MDPKRKAEYIARVDLMIQQIRILMALAVELRTEMENDPPA